MALAATMPVAYAQTPGNLTAQRWNNLPNTSSFLTLTADGIAKRTPDTTALFAGAQWGPNLADRYGVRLRGTVTAPVTGDYTFYTAGDDHTELWLSTDASRFNKRKIAWNLKHTASLAWTVYPTQRSRTVRLTAGQSYYLEALLHEIGGADHLAVGWSYHAPLPLAATAIGSPVTQSWSETNGVISLSVDGGDIWGTADRFGFYNASWTGDGEIIARIPAMNNVYNWVKVGVMIRATTATGSAQAMMVRSSPVNGMAFQRRKTQGASSVSTSGGPVREWVKLVRKGETITGWSSADGREWVQMGSDTFPGLPQTVLVGIAASDINPNATLPVIATVDHFEVKALTATEVIPTSALTSLAPDPADADDDNLPDAWEITHGLNPASALGNDGQYGDLDNDGISNFEEYVLGSNPAVKESLADGLTRERWENLNGLRVTDLTLNRARFLNRPDEISHVPAVNEENYGDTFATRYRGAITAPVTGTYRFWISGDDEAELWLADGSVTKEISGVSTPLLNRYGKRRIAWIQSDNSTSNYTSRNNFDKFSNQHSGEIQLQSGETYYFEVLHKEGTGADHVSVAWQVPGTNREIIPASAFTSDVPEDDDRDDDYLPDGWETLVGLSPTDNGLTDARNGQYGDWDADGLTNLEEYQLGTNPKAADTDGDGLSDKEERDFYRSNPLVNNQIPPSLHTSVTLATPLGGSTGWTPQPDGSVISGSRRGWVEYPFTVAPGQEGMFEIRLTGGAGGAVRSVENMPLEFSIDGGKIGNATLVSQNGGNASVKQLTPWLTAGDHVLRVNGLNYRADMHLRIQELGIYSLGGTDTDSDGTPDWVEDRLGNFNAITRAPAQSRVSPVCLEGLTDSLPTLKLVRQEGETETPVPILAGVNHGFYADVDLDATSPTDLTFRFQNGALEASRSITWTATNPLDTSSLVLRKGDALRVAAWQPGHTPSGTFTLTLDGQPISAQEGGTTHASGNPIVVDFNNPGTRTLTATWTPGDGSPAVTGTTQVTVREASFGTAFDLLAWNRRTWSVPGIATGLPVEADNSLTWAETTTTGQPRSFLVSTYDTGTKHVLARVPETGDILARGTVNGFDVAQVDRTADAQLIEVLPDGTRRYRFTIVAANLPANAEVRIRTYYQGATFPDGGRDLVLRPDDFNSNGIADIYIEWGPDGNPSLCHSIDIFIVDAQ